MALIAALQTDLARAALSPKELALLRLGEVLTLDPHASPAAVAAARTAGWSDQEVADAIFLVSVFNMMTRIADAFALPPDASHPYDPAGTIPMASCGP